MKAYIAAGRYVGTQAEAKALDRNFRLEEIPTDKDGLLAYLNAVTGQTTAPVAELPATIDFTVKNDPVPIVDNGEKCPKCKFNHKQAAKIAEHAVRSATAEARVGWIDEAAPWELGAMAGAIAERFRTFETEALV